MKWAAPLGDAMEDILDEEYTGIYEGRPSGLDVYIRPLLHAERIDLQPFDVWPFPSPQAGTGYHACHPHLRGGCLSLTTDVKRGSRLSNHVVRDVAGKDCHIEDRSGFLRKCW